MFQSEWTVGGKQVYHAYESILSMSYVALQLESLSTILEQADICHPFCYSKTGKHAGYQSSGSFELYSLSNFTYDSTRQFRGTN